jgi:hypothetical protein
MGAALGAPRALAASQILWKNFQFRQRAHWQVHTAKPWAGILVDSNDALLAAGAAATYYPNRSRTLVFGIQALSEGTHETKESKSWPISTR